jgi:hypothetical protein
MKGTTVVDHNTIHIVREPSEVVPTLDVYRCPPGIEKEEERMKLTYHTYVLDNKHDSVTSSCLAGPAMKLPMTYQNSSERDRAQEFGYIRLKKFPTRT